MAVLPDRSDHSIPSDTGSYNTELPSFWWYSGGMSDDEIKMTIRLTPGLHERLGQAAERDHRSKHAQMVVYIERGLDQDDRDQAREGSR